jgi:hypothetical protein
MRSSFLRWNRASIWALAGGALAGCGSSTPVTVPLSFDASDLTGSGGGGAGGNDQTPTDGGATGDGSFQVPAGIGVGGACSASMSCRPGLSCGADSKCALGHSLPAGSACVLNGECATGNICTWVGLKRQCAPGGQGTAGTTCQGDTDCAAGLRCSIVGFGAQCAQEGSGDVKSACKTSTDCLGGLACYAGTCNVTIPGTPSFGFPTWAGETCEQDSGPPISYFRVPRATGNKDFYRLPFPNDIRTKNGHPDLTGHPTPGSELLGFDPVDRYLRAIEAENDGFGAYSTVYFRFSAQFKLLPGGVNTPSSFGIVDVTKNDPAFGQPYPTGTQWLSWYGGSKYICGNYAALRLADGTLYQPGHTYAVYLHDVTLAPNGGPIGQDPEFAAMLASTPPADPALAAAYAKYQPFRDYLALTPDAGPKPPAADTIVNAAVFTIGHADREITNLAAAVQALPAPAPTGWVKCGAAPSPCQDATGDRACDATQDAAFDELQANVPLPIFQSGTAPYLSPQDGGQINVTSPTVVRTQNVCLSLTVPKGVAMPANGWPLVIYAHGTGGSYRSHIKEGIAKALATVSADNTVPIAVLGIDQVQHGPRRGASTESPNNLFYNFANPYAARDNAMQGAVDQMSLAKMAAGLDVGAALTGSDVKIDPAAIMFWGHSQGATEGGISAPRISQVSGVVFSGQGASLIDALLTKTSPVNIAAAVPFALSDIDPAAPTKLPGSIFHPVLSLLQSYIDPADPLNHAAGIAPAASGGHHVFQVYGQNDTYAPSTTQYIYAKVAQLGVVAHDPKVTAPDFADPMKAHFLQENGATASLSKNIGGRLTAAFRQYAQPGAGDAGTLYDGHFVAYHNPTAQHDIYRFLDDLAKGQAPTVAPSP